MKLLVKVVALGLAFAFARPAFAADWFLKQSDGSGKSSMNGVGSPNSWTNAAGQTANAMAAGNNYTVDNGFEIRTPDQYSGTQNYTAPGNLMTFGGSKSGLLAMKSQIALTLPPVHAYRLTVSMYDNKPYTLKGGDITLMGGNSWMSLDVRRVNNTSPAHTNTVENNIMGDGTVRIGFKAAAVLPYALRLKGDNSGYVGRVVNTNGTMAGSLIFLNAASWFGNPAAYAQKSVDLSPYAVHMVFNQTMSLATPNREVFFGETAPTWSAPAGATVTIGAPLAGTGTLSFARGGTAGTATFALTVANPKLTGAVRLLDGTVLDIRTASALTAASVAGPSTGLAKIAVDMDTVGADGVALAALPSGNIRYVVSASALPPGGKFRFLVLPAGASDLSADSVNLTVGGVTYGATVEHVVEGGSKIVYLGVSEPKDDTLYLMGSDPVGASAFTGLGETPGWSDTSKAVVSGKSYLINGGFSARTPEENASYSFPGDSLTLSNGTAMLKIYRSQSFTVPDLRVASQSIGTVHHVADAWSGASNAKNPVYLRGTRWLVNEGGVLRLNVGSSGASAPNRRLFVEVPIEGTGDVLARDTEKTYDCVVRFEASLQNLHGRLRINGGPTLTVAFGAGTGAPGALTAACADGFGIEGNPLVVFEESLALDATRGVAISNCPTLRVESGKTVTVNGAFSATNGFVKTGSGHLVLNGTAALDAKDVQVLSGSVTLPGGTVLKPPAEWFGPVKARFASELIRTKGGATAVLAAVATVPALQADGTWADIDYTSHAKSSWPPFTHLTRCEKYAAAYYLTSNTTYSAAIVSAMNAWYVKNPTSQNWWWSHIGNPESMGHTLVLAEDQLRGAACWSKMIADMAVDVDYGNVQTGQNLLWTRAIRFVHGTLEEDYEEMYENAGIIVADVKVVHQGLDGIQTDGTFHQHGVQPQTGNYALSYLQDTALWVRVFAGEAYAYPQEKLDIITSGMIGNCMEWENWKGILEPATRGRLLTRSLVSLGTQLTNVIALYGREIQSPLGYRYFDKSGYSIYRARDWMAGIRMGDKTVVSTESCNGNNAVGKFMGDGSIWTLVTGLEYEYVYALWDDWRMIPGVTQLRGVAVPESTWLLRNPTAKQSGNSTLKKTTFTYGEEEGLSYKKTWTFKDRGYDVSVTNVTVTSEAPAGRTDVATCIENANACANAGLVARRKKFSVYRNGEVYYIVRAQPEQIVFTLENREGDVHYYDRDTPEGTMISGKVFQLLVSHGKDPNDAGLVYHVRIGGWGEFKSGLVITLH